MTVPEPTADLDELPVGTAINRLNRLAEPETPAAVKAHLWPAASVRVPLPGVMTVPVDGPVGVGVGVVVGARPRFRT